MEGRGGAPLKAGKFAAAHSHRLLLRAVLLLMSGMILLQELQTALHIAARQGDVDGVELLLQRGAAPNVVTTDLNTPLHGAAREGHDNVAKVLLDYGANMALANKVRACHRSSLNSRLSLKQTSH